MRPDPPDLPARLEPAGTLDAGGLQEATLSDAHLDGLQAPGVKIDACVRSHRRRLQRDAL